MKAVILAAGIGSRIRPLTDNKPKSLLDMNGKPILQRMIENIQAAGISEILIVTGYLEDQIKEFIKSHFPTLSVQYVLNKTYDTTNTGYSLMLAKEFAENSDFVKFDADVVFDKEILKRLLTSNYPNCLSIDKNINLAAEEIKVTVDENNKIVKANKEVNPSTAVGESIGIEKISKDVAPLLFNELEKMMSEEKNHQKYYECAYENLIEKGIPFYPVDITGLHWVEIDTHEDYQNALQLFAS